VGISCSVAPAPACYGLSCGTTFWRFTPWGVLDHASASASCLRHYCGCWRLARLRMPPAKTGGRCLRVGGGRTTSFSENRRRTARADETFGRAAQKKLGRISTALAPPLPPRCAAAQERTAHAPRLSSIRCATRAAPRLCAAAAKRGERCEARCRRAHSSSRSTLMRRAIALLLCTASSYRCARPIMPLAAAAKYVTVLRTARRVRIAPARGRGRHRSPRVRRPSSLCNDLVLRRGYFALCHSAVRGLNHCACAAAQLLPRAVVDAPLRAGRKTHRRDNGNGRLRRLGFLPLLSAVQASLPAPPHRTREDLPCTSLRCKNLLSLRTLFSLKPRRRAIT